MNKFKMLSGDQLVAQGAKKASVSLPEIGLKDVFPNGSWLEQKQIQNALEARKHLVEVERIDKVGVLSLAHWREDLKLAEVTQKCGGHWQYLGHTVGKHWYIYPEETLLLMEMNCLQLKHNDVTVSIQKAYSLLLNDAASLVKYKVYASLSRLGYKVFRHDKSQTYNTSNIEAENTSIDATTEKENELTDIPENQDGLINNTNESKSEINASPSMGDGDSTTTVKEQKYKSNECESVTMEIDNANNNVEVSSSMNLCEESNEKTSEDCNVDMGSNSSTGFIQNRLEILCNREIRPCNSYLVHQSFKDLPDLYQKHVVTVKAPEEKHIPRNIFLNNTAYVINLGSLRLKNVNPAPSSSCHTYTSSDDVNECHVRRIRSSFSNESAQSNWTPPFFPNMRFSQQTNHYRQFNYWSYNFNMAFQRPFYPSMPLRFQVFPRMQPMFRCFNSSSVFTQSNITDPGRPQKRKRQGTKKYHLDSIKKLALKLKSLVQSGNRQEQNIHALQRLINTYNIRYKAKLQLTDALDIIENEIILETIELDDDDQSSSKKKKGGDENNSYEQNFDTLKNIALRIKELDGKSESSPRHRRALSNAIKTFNKSYDADIYVNSNYEVIDRRQIIIASSSDSECAVETPKPKKSKKLRNPFYILKQLSKKQNENIEHNSRKETSNDSDCIPRKKFEYSELLRETFDKNWLPSEDDFGRAEMVRGGGTNSRLRDYSEDFLYEFMSGGLYNNWLDAKIAYWQSCKESAIKFEANTQNQSNIKLNSLINPDDCTDLKTVLKKLSIIKTNKDVKDECSLNIDFDVYNRDVQNFKKTNKPKPHFRIICIEESSKFPSGIELTTHRSKYVDDISIVFAVVGTASISYLQITPTDLPVYIPSFNLP